MASKNITAALLPIVLIAAPVWAGHVTMVNQTDQYLRLQCGEHHDGGGTSPAVEPGRVGEADIHEHGSVRCRVLDDRDRTFDAKRFDFHEGGESFVWVVNDSDHHGEGGGHGDGDEEDEKAESLKDQLADQVDLLKGLFGGGGGDDD